MGMRAQYIGDPNNDFEGPRILYQFDHAFPKNRWIVIDETQKEAKLALFKLPGHPHFKTELFDSAAAVDLEATFLSTQPASSFSQPGPSMPMGGQNGPQVSEARAASLEQLLADQGTRTTDTTDDELARLQRDLAGGGTATETTTQVDLDPTTPGETDPTDAGPNVAVEKAFYREELARMGKPDPHQFTGLNKLKNLYAAAKEEEDFKTGEGDAED